MRWNEQWKEFAIACASVVLPTPGDISDEEVTLREKCHNRKADHFILAANDTSDGILQLRNLVGRGGCSHLVENPWRFCYKQLGAGF